MSCIGSFVSAGTPADHITSATVFTDEGIVAKYKITRKEISRIKDILMNMKLSDILFAYPDGPQYDVLLKMIATSR